MASTMRGGERVGHGSRFGGVVGSTPPLTERGDLIVPLGVADADFRSHCFPYALDDTDAGISEGAESPAKLACGR